MVIITAIKELDTVQPTMMHNLAYSNVNSMTFAISSPILGTTGACLKKMEIKKTMRKTMIQ